MKSAVIAAVSSLATLAVIGVLLFAYMSEVHAFWWRTFVYQPMASPPMPPAVIDHAAIRQMEKRGPQ